VAPAPVILARSHVPVLCFHQVRDWAAGDSPSARAMITPPQRFAAQIDALARAAQRQDPRAPLLTIRRVIAASGWDGPALLRHLPADF